MDSTRRGSGDPVNLLAHRAPSFKHKSPGDSSPHSPTFSLNGKVCPFPPSVDCDGIRLIRYSKTGSFEDLLAMENNNSHTTSHQSEMSKRQEHLSKLMKETQEWFKQHQEANKMAEIKSERFDGDRMQRFIQEASVKCASSSKEQFADFVRQNQQSFAQLLEDSASRFNNLKLQPPAASPVDRDSGVFTDHDSYTTETRVKREAFQVHSFSASSSSSNLHSLANENGDADCGASTGGSMKNSDTDPDIQALLRNNPLERPVCLFKKMDLNDMMSVSEPQLRLKPRPFSDFPKTNHYSPSFSPSSKLSFESSRMSSSYHFSTSRSKFEYCGETNTYRFSTEQVCQRFEQGYESVSESEDEEESLEDISSIATEESRDLDDQELKEDKTDNHIVPSIEYKKDKVHQNLQRIANELLTTEKTYVSILHLLDQVFAFRVDQENRAHPMFPQEVVTQMFSNLKSLYKLHHDFLLPKLEERIEVWEAVPRIGDIMKDFAPFLKMYTEYVKNYDNAMHLIGLWYNKQPRFMAIMDDVHRMKECGNLTLQHHMLTPVQRVPRYQLLLKEYLKKLPEDSPDRADTEKALELVSTAAHHANEAMKKIDKFKKLLEIQELVGGVIDLVSPTRELLKDGKITKISARSGDHQERHLFLFNDLALVCSQRLISNRVVSGPCYRVRAKLDIDGLIVQEGNNLETANTFYIRNTGRAIELCAQCPDEKMEWMQALAKAVHDLKLRKSSLRVRSPGTKSPEGFELGQKAPTLMKTESVSHCMKCGTSFSTFSFKWKHHCHACGIVACSKCLTHKIRLAFDNNKTSRVCSSCYTTISQNYPDKVDAAEKNLRSPIDSPIFPPEAVVISSYLKLKTGSRGAWTRRWFALHKDFVLYSFRSEEDYLPLTSMPVPGFEVALPEKGDGIDPKAYNFKLFHPKKTYFFQASDAEEVQRWIAALEKASRAEDPG